MADLVVQGRVVTGGDEPAVLDIAVADGVITRIGANLAADAGGLVALPGAGRRHRQWASTSRWARTPRPRAGRWPRAGSPPA